MTLASLMEGLESEIRARSASGLVKWAERFLGMPYWYGTYCNPCSQDLYNGKREQYPAHYTSSRADRYKADIKAGKVCADCIGLIKGFAWQNLDTGKLKYGTNGCPDNSANGMYEYCCSKGMPHGNIGTLPDVPGIMLHRSGHVGVYIGGGKAIEERGFAYGCVKTNVDGRGWQHWTYLPFIAYEGGAVVKPVSYKLGDRMLETGDEGPDVQTLQAALQRLGYNLGSAGADGDFGSRTLAAVTGFQADCDLEIDGIVGPQTIAALNKALAQLDSGAPVPTDGDATIDKPTPAATLTVDATELNVRTGPGTQYPSVDKVYSCDKLVPVNTKGWQPVLIDGKVLWVSAQYVKA